MTSAATKWRENRAQGLCGACGKAEAVPGHARCVACMDVEHYNQRAYRLRNREAIAGKMANRYWQLVDAGLCVTCGKNPAKEGGRRCFECAVKASEATIRSRNRRKEREDIKR